jgi:hypothetical protein
MIEYKQIDKNTVQRIETIDLKPINNRIAEIEAELKEVEKLPDQIMQFNKDKIDRTIMLKYELEELNNKLKQWLQQ